MNQLATLLSPSTQEMLKRAHPDLDAERAQSKCGLTREEEAEQAAMRG